VFLDELFMKKLDSKLQWGYDVIPHPSAPRPNGRRNKHGIPLRRLLIFGRAGLSEVQSWVKEWLK
jgi:hypothetical protein